MNQTRVAVVTGAGRGIGAEVARRLAAEGRRVALLDLDLGGARVAAERINEEFGPGLAHAIAVDVSDEAAVGAGIEEVVETLGVPTILVNNAGVIRDNLLFRMSLDDWELVMHVHLRGAFLMARAVQSHMVAAGFGRIVNVSSTSALGNKGQANYSTAKAGLQGLTKTLALELGKFGITSNCIGPGFVQTEMTAEVARRGGIAFDELIADSASRIPVGRVGQPEDIANAVAFFTGEDAGYVSGQVLYVAGGPKA